MWEDTFFKARNEDNGEFQSLDSVNRRQRHAVCFSRHIQTRISTVRCTQGGNISEKRPQGFLRMIVPRRHRTQKP